MIKTLYWLPISKKLKKALCGIISSSLGNCSVTLQVQGICSSILSAYMQKERNRDRSFLSLEINLLRVRALRKSLYWNEYLNLLKRFLVKIIFMFNSNFLVQLAFQSSFFYIALLQIYIISIYTTFSHIYKIV